CQQYSGLPLTF
nr:immunoglobulin light chain junction region [Macaca mulatta]